VRDGAFPHRLECAGAHRHHGRVIRQYVVQEVAIAGEVTEPDEPVVEYPEVVAWQAQDRCPGRLR